jgi:hypothetical protein
MLFGGCLEAKWVLLLHNFQLVLFGEIQLIQVNNIAYVKIIIFTVKKNRYLYLFFERISTVRMGIDIKLLTHANNGENNCVYIYEGFGVVCLWTRKTNFFCFLLLCLYEKTTILFIV